MPQAAKVLQILLLQSVMTRMVLLTGRQTDIQAGRQTDGNTDGETDRLDKQTGGCNCVNVSNAMLIPTPRAKVGIA